MMNAAFAFLLWSACAVLASGIEIEAKTHIEHPGKCIDLDDNPREVGETWEDRDRCERSTCKEMNGILMEDFQGCNRIHFERMKKLEELIQSGKNCKLEKDVKPQFPYPHCCEDIVCEGDDGEDYTEDESEKDESEGEGDENESEKDENKGEDYTEDESEKDESKGQGDDENKSEKDEGEDYTEDESEKDESKGEGGDKNESEKDENKGEDYTEDESEKAESKHLEFLRQKHEIPDHLTIQ